MSSFGQIPSSGNISLKNTGRSSNAETVKIIRLPEALQNNARAVKVEGTVTQSNNNGSVRIQTERGAIDVQFSSNNGDKRAREAPRTGERVELNIPAGRPPRQANVARAPQQNTQQNAPKNTEQQTTIRSQGQEARTLPQSGQQAQNKQTQTTQGQSAQLQNVAAPPARLPNAPLPPQNISQAAQSGQSTAPAPPASFPPAPLAEGTNVRLVALPPNQALQVSQLSLSVLTTQNNIVTQTAFTANLIAQNTVSQLGQSTLNIGIPAPIKNQPATLQIQNIGQSLSQPPTNNAVQPIRNTSLFQNIAPNTGSFLSTLSAINLLPTNQVSTAPQLQNIGLNATIVTTQTALTETLQSIGQNTLTAFKSNASLTALSNPLGLTTNSAIGKIDVQVLYITPNTVNLIAPMGQGNKQQINIPALTQFTLPLTSNNNATTLTGQVTGVTAQGQPLITLQIPGAPLPQSFIIQYTPNNITIGAQIQLRVQNVGLVPTQSALTAQSPALTTMLQGFQWGAFDDTLQSLIQTAPQTANSLIRSLPNAGNPAQLGAVGAAVMAAVKGGDLSTWLGDKKVETLQRLSKSGSLSRLTQDTALTPRTEATSNSDWRAVPLPMFWEGEIHKITLFMRQESQSQNQDKSGEGSTRFIFDLDLSRMGDVQLDGLLREGRLDLVVRTQNGFSEPMQQVMRGAYSNAIKQAGMNGDVSFQGHTNNWVHVIKEGEKLGVNV